MVVTRFATAADLPDLVALGAAFFRAHPFAAFISYDGGSVEQTVASLLTSPTACVLVSIESDVLVGCLLGMAVPLWFHADCLVATELAWFMDPAYRHRQYAMALYQQFETWAHIQGCQGIIMTALSSFPQIGEVYTRLGFMAYEQHFVKRM